LSPSRAKHSPAGFSLSGSASALEHESDGRVPCLTSTSCGVQINEALHLVPTLGAVALHCPHPVSPWNASSLFSSRDGPVRSYPGGQSQQMNRLSTGWTTTKDWVGSEIEGLGPALRRQREGLSTRRVGGGGADSALDARDICSMRARSSGVSCIVSVSSSSFGPRFGAPLGGRAARSARS